MKVNSLVKFQFPYGPVGSPVMVPVNTEVAKVIRGKVCQDLFRFAIMAANDVVAYTEKVAIWPHIGGLIATLKKTDLVGKVECMCKSDRERLAWLLISTHATLCEELDHKYKAFDPTTTLQAIWDFLEEVKEDPQC